MAAAATTTTAMTTMMVTAMRMRMRMRMTMTNRKGKSREEEVEQEEQETSPHQTLRIAVLHIRCQEHSMTVELHRRSRLNIPNTPCAPSQCKLQQHKKWLTLIINTHHLSIYYLSIHFSILLNIEHLSIHLNILRINRTPTMPMSSQTTKTAAGMALPSESYVFHEAKSVNGDHCGSRI